MILILGIFWTIYGITGLFGFCKIPQNFKNKPWTKQYTRYLGISWIMAGIPWIILYFVFEKWDIGIATQALLMIVCSAPSIIYNFLLDRNYKNKND